MHTVQAVKFLSQSGGFPRNAQVDGQVTRLWKFFFRPASGTTDRLGFSIPMGDKLDQVRVASHHMPCHPGDACSARDRRKRKAARLNGTGQSSERRRQNCGARENKLMCRVSTGALFSKSCMGLRCCR